MWVADAARVVATGFVVALVACGDAPAEVQDVPPPPSVDGSALTGTVRPAPNSAVGLGRAAFGALQGDDWEGYVNLLVTRADMLGVFAEVDRNTGRKRRGRRRKVWRRVTRLRNGEAERGWKKTRRSAKTEGLAWATATLVDVRRTPLVDHQLPPRTDAGQLVLVVESHGTEYAIELGTCLHATRGWVTIHPMKWRGPVLEPLAGESLLHPTPVPDPPQ